MRAEPTGADGTSRFAAWIAPVAPAVALLRNSCRGLAARVAGLASGLALAVRPAGSVEVSSAQGQGPEDRFCEAVRSDLRVPLTLEGPTRTMCGILAVTTVTFARRPAYPGGGGLVLLVVAA
jgi:hypothetical protein